MASAPKINLPASLKSSDDDRIVRKSNDEIGYRIRSGHLSLLARKSFNALIWHAQEMRGQEDDLGRWKIPVSRLIKDVKFNSRDYALLHEAMNELQDVKVVRPARHGGITSEVLVPSFTIDNVEHPDNSMLKRGEKKRGGELWLWFMFPPELKAQLMDPEQYTRLPIAIMATLKTIPGLALYEICRRYVTNPGGVTNRDDWQNWWRILTGAAEDVEPPEYKYAKRDVFKRGVEEINQVTDIEVELIEFKVGKFVRQIQFGVKLKQQGNLDMGPPPIDAGLLSQLTELGMSISDAERIIARHHEKEVIDTLELLRQRVSNTQLPAIESKAAFFRSALKNGYAAGKKLEGKPKEIKPRNTLPEKADDPEKQVARQAAIEAFNNLPGEEQQTLLTEFATTLKGPSAKAFKASGLDHPLTGPAFAGWLTRQKT